MNWGFCRHTARALDRRGGVRMDRFPDTGADQIQRSTENPACDSSCASGGEHRAG